MVFLPGYVAGITRTWLSSRMALHLFSTFEQRVCDTGNVRYNYWIVIAIKKIPSQFKKLDPA